MGRYRKIGKLYKGSRFNAFDVILYIFLFAFAILCLYPLWFVLIGSFNEGTDYSAGGVYFFTRKWSFASYRLVFTDKALYKAILVTFGRTAIGTITSTLFTGMVAYGMSQRDLFHKKFFYWFNVFTMFFGGGLIPFFLLIVNLGLYDSFWVYIIPGLYSVYNMIVISTYYKSIPYELKESAIIDGADEWTIFFKIYLPLAVPILATVALWTAVGHWNAYYDTMIYTTDPNLHTLQYYLMRLIKLSSMPESTSSMPPEVLKEVISTTISYAAIIISCIPVIFFFPVVQRIYFKEDLTKGSVK